MKKVIVITLIIVVIVAAGGLFGFQYLRGIRRQISELSAELTFYESAAASERDWLKSLALDNGALAFRPVAEGEAYINPYYACITAIALSETGDKACIQTVKSYLDWHFSHLNSNEADINGLDYTIYNFTAAVTNGRVVSEATDQSYDSADSYAAVFISALAAYYRATGDADYVLSHYEAFEGILNVIKRCTQDHGLTIARPDYPVCYLMDNCEVHAALSDAAALIANVYIRSQDTVQNERAQQLYHEVNSMSRTLIQAIEAYLWNESASHYEVSMQSEYHYSSFNWVNLYPDAASQLFTILCGVVKNDSSRAGELFSRFSRYQSWQEMGHYTSGESSFYWGSIAYCAALMGDLSGLKSYLSWYIGNVADGGYEYPIFNADSAWILRAENHAAAVIRSEMDRLDPINLFHD